MAQAVLELIAKTEGWTGGIKRAQTGLTNFIKTHGGLHQALAQDNKTMADAIRKFGDFESKAATVAGRIRETETAFMELGVTYKQMTAAERATPAGKVTLEQLNKLAPKIREMKAQVKDLQGLVSLEGGVGFGARFMQGLVPGLGMGVGAAGAMMAVQVAQKAMRELKEQVVDTVRVNMDFEQSNANLAAILGTTTAGVERLTANAKRLGGETKFTASEITELQTVLARRGLSEDQILNMTHGITNLAIATGTDLAQSAELAASTMQAFGMRATEMERIVSVLGVSTTKSALTTEALGTSLQYVAPAARAVDFSLEDTVSILGTLVDNGISASIAGTSLRQIMLSMSTSSGKLAKALGGPVKNFDEMVEALKRLKAKGGDSLESVSKAVRVTALPAFLALVNNADRLDELRESITGVEGELQKMSDTQMSTAKGAKIVFQSAIEGLKLTFEESTGAMRNYYVWMTNIVNKWKEARALRNGGESAVNVFAWDDQTIQSKAQERIARERAYGRTDEQIANGAKWVSENTYGDGRIDKFLSFYRMLDGLGDYTDFKTKYKQQFDELGINTEGLIGDVLERMARTIADFRNNKAVEDYIYSKLGPKMLSAGGGLGVDEESDSDRIVSALDKLGKGKTPAEKAADILASAQEAYAEALNKAAIEKEAGLLDEEKYSNRLLTAEEILMDAYSRAAAISGSEEYKTAFTNEVTKVKELAEQTAALTKARKDAEDAEKEAKRVADETARELLRLDRSMLGGINSAVGSSSWQRINDSDGGALHERFGAMKLQLQQGVEIPDAKWEEFVADLNEKLEGLNLPTIKLDLETNSVTRMADEVKNMAGAWNYASQTIGSVSSALGSLENPAAKVAGIIAGAIAEMAAGLGAAIAQKGKELEPWSWIAFAAASTATFVSSVAAVKAATAEYHAGGGLAGMGSVFTPRGKDTVPAMLAPREEVLPETSWRHQKNIGRYLQGSAGGYDVRNFHLETSFEAERVRVMLVNNSKRRGGTGKNFSIQ